MLTNRIVLGTAQFGLEYGIANQVGMLSKKDVFAILEFAHREGMDTLDMAYSYGKSESIIGEFFSRFYRSFNVISKLPNMDNPDAQMVDKYFSETLSRLKQTKIYGYLVHKFANIVSNENLWHKIESLKNKGCIDKIGVSIYEPWELEYLLNNRIRFDIIQVPYNIFDQRFDRYFPELKKRSVETCIRSVFLQGLFFLEKDRIEKDFQPAKSAIGNLRKISLEHSIPLNALCFCFVLLNSFVDKVIIGIDSLEQLKQNLDSLKYFDKVKKIYNSLKSLELRDEKVLLPYRWK
jgi:aryl-alcohol dehydrogenase-like predicted oxidoreductase